MLDSRIEDNSEKIRELEAEIQELRKWKEEHERYHRYHPVNFRGT